MAMLINIYNHFVVNPYKELFPLKKYTQFLKNCISRTGSRKDLGPTPIILSSCDLQFAPKVKGHRVQKKITLQFQAYILGKR